MTTEGPRSEIRCVGCRRRIGYAYSTKLGGIYCTDATCQHLPASKMQDARDDVILLLRQRGHSTAELATLFEVSSQRISQIIANTR